MQEEDIRGDCKRTTVEQLEYFVGYINKHPELLSNKNDPTDPNRVKNLWSQLGNALNALNGPIRSATKWKETLSHWKNQLRSRVRKAKVHRITTGGGPPSNIRFKDFEERAFEAIGTVAIDGLPGVPTLGLDKIDLSMSSQENEQSGYQNTEFLDEYLLPDEPTMFQGPSKFTDAGTPPRLPVKNHKSNTSTNDLLNQILQMAKDRDERERKTQEENLLIQKSIADALKSIAETLQSVSEAMTNVKKAQ